jgi:hypothetical protein
MSTQQLLALLALVFAVLSLVPYPDTWPARASGWLLAIAVLLLAVLEFAS